MPADKVEPALEGKPAVAGSGALEAMAGVQRALEAWAEPGDKRALGAMARAREAWVEPGGKRALEAMAREELGNA